MFVLGIGFGVWGLLLGFSGLAAVCSKVFIGFLRWGFIGLCESLGWRSRASEACWNGVGAWRCCRVYRVSGLWWLIIGCEVGH